MRICPDCTEPLTAERPLHCAACGWRGEVREGVPVYLSSADRKDPLMADYTANYDEIHELDMHEGIIDERFLHNIAKKTADAVIAPAGKRVLDIGVGRGLLAEALLARGAQSVTAVDIALGYLKRLDGRPGIEPVLANAENLPFADAFDIVVTTDVMEHVLNVGSFLYAMNRALKPGGRAYVRVPLEEDLMVYSPHVGCKHRLVHLRSFDRRIARLYLRNAGFTVERIVPDSFWFNWPARFWTGAPWRRRLYDRFEAFMRRRLEHPSDIELLDARIACLFMRPMEMLIVARKTGVIERHPGGGGVVREVAPVSEAGMVGTAPDDRPAAIAAQRVVSPGGTMA